MRRVVRRTMHPAVLIHLRHLSRSATIRYPRKGGLSKNDVPSLTESIQELTRKSINGQITRQTLKIVKTVKSIANQETTPQAGVQQITCLANNKTLDEFKYMCGMLWKQTVDELRNPKVPTHLIAEFLIHLSGQPQGQVVIRHKRSLQNQVEDDEQGARLLPVERLWNWHDMPELLTWIRHLGCGANDVPSKASERASSIAHLYKEAYFVSLLCRTPIPIFRYHNYLAWILYQAFDCNKDPLTRENCKIWIPAVDIIMEIAGSEIKKQILRVPPELQGRFTIERQRWRTGSLLNMDRWNEWQRRVLNVSADDSIDTEFRKMAKGVYGLMAM